MPTKHKKLIATIILFVAIFFSTTPCLSDKWAMPEERSYSSANDSFIFTVIPPGKGPNNKPYCEGTLIKKNKDGTKKIIWTRELINKTAPTDAMVSDNGFYVVTLDNWFSAGHGDNVVVIYGREGNLIKKFSLNDFFSPQEINNLPHSITSILWTQSQKGHYFDESANHVILKARPSAKFKRTNNAVKALLIKIELSTGTFFGPLIPEYYE